MPFGLQFRRNNTPMTNDELVAVSMPFGLQFRRNSKQAANLPGHLRRVSFYALRASIPTEQPNTGSQQYIDRFVSMPFGLQFRRNSSPWKAVVTCDDAACCAPRRPMRLSGL
jgi:hypothetical protein